MRAMFLSLPGALRSSAIAVLYSPATSLSRPCARSANAPPASAQVMTSPARIRLIYRICATTLCLSNRDPVVSSIRGGSVEGESSGQSGAVQRFRRVPEAGDQGVLRSRLDHAEGQLHRPADRLGNHVVRTREGLGRR